MEGNKHGLLWAVIIVVIIIVVVVVMQGGGARETGPIKIGLSLPLTGDLAFIGEADRDAAQLAIEEINAQQGLKHTYELVIEDDSFDAAKASSVIQKFISIDKVDAVISIGSTAGNVIAPITESNKIPHIGMASDPIVAEGTYNFINWTRPQEEVDAMIKEMKSRGITKVAIIGVNQQGFLAISDDFKEKSKVAGISYVEEIFNPGQTDFRTIITKLQKDTPQIYLLGAFDPEIGVIGKQIRNLGIQTPLTSIESFGLTSDAKPFEGQWFVDAAVPTSEFNTKFQAKYGKAPGPAAPNTYDSIHLLARSFEAVPGNGKPSSDQVVEALGNLEDYNGALGTLVAGPGGAFISQATVKVIRDGQAVTQ